MAAGVAAVLRVLGPVLLPAALAFFLADAPAWAGSADSRPPPSPRTSVPPASCDGETPCPVDHWVFRPPDCQDGDLVHPPGTVVLFADETMMQCHCRLTWLRTKPGKPPDARVTCRWIDVDEARTGD